MIIDGRIADICETGFLEGTLVVPQFVLRELQQVADSSDSLKRNRGRRGLDILQKIQKMANVTVQIVETDFPDIREVDLKLIELARSIGGKIVTNDFNLNKVAQLRGVPVLNINELANSLKPVVLPGELMKVFVIKEGKEAGQGVGYLDDGTMVVVDQAQEGAGQDHRGQRDQRAADDGGQDDLLPLAGAPAVAEEPRRDGRVGRPPRPAQRRATCARRSAARSSAATASGPAAIARSRRPRPGALARPSGPRSRDDAAPDARPLEAGGAAAPRRARPTRAKAE